jgi:hypothetical protein
VGLFISDLPKRTARLEKLGTCCKSVALSHGANFVAMLHNIGMNDTPCRSISAQVVIAILAIAISTRETTAANTINSVTELWRALKSCVVSSNLSLRPGVTLVARMGFRKDGELLGKPFIFFQAPNVMEEEKQRCRVAVQTRSPAAHPFPSVANLEMRWRANQFRFGSGELVTVRSPYKA